MERSKCKGFAYEQNNQKPMVVFGESKEEILEKLQGFNKTRVAEKQFATCNVGSLSENGKYADYHKYKVIDGTEIEKIYFKIPPMSREEFFKTKRELEEHGARFEPAKKMMCVDRQEDMSFFEPYINNTHNVQHETNSAKEDNTYEKYEQDLIEKAEVKIPNFTIGEPVFKLNFVDGSKPMYINLSDVGIKTDWMDRFSVLEFADKLQAAIIAQITDEKDYQIGISKENNECSVYFKDGRETIVIYGEEYNVDFSNLTKEEVESLVNDYMEGSKEIDNDSKQDIKEYDVGERVDVYVPQYDTYKDVSGIEHIQGHIKEVVRNPKMVETLTYVIEDEMGNEHRIEGKEIYTPQQTDVILKAIDQGIQQDELSLLSDPRFSAAQMTKLLEGYKDGLNYLQVAIYANPMLQISQMDICRIGLVHGVDMDKLPYKPLPDFDWVAARKQLSVDIKEHRQELAEVFKRAGFNPSEKLVKSLQELNHLKHRPQSLDDICVAYKDKAGLDLFSKEGQLVKEIGDSLRYQEIQMSQGMVPGS